jgi:hypothetical protein
MFQVARKGEAKLPGMFSDALKFEPPVNALT